MNYLTHQLLNAEEINLIKEELLKDNQDWEDGKSTAGSYASKVKNNLQLNRQSNISQKLSLMVMKKILNNDLIKSFTLPKHIHGIMFTKSSKGMNYDVTLIMHICPQAGLTYLLRFFSRKNQYKGGELLIENLTSEMNLNLIKGGSLFIQVHIYIQLKRFLMEKE